MQPTLPQLTTERLVLRFATEQDASEVLDFYVRNREFFERTNPARADGEYTIGFWQAHAQRMREEFWAGRGCYLFGFLRDDAQRVIASVNLFSIVRGSFHAATLGYCMDERWTRRGLMSEAVTEVVRYAFEELRLHRIMANYWCENEASGGLLSKLGFEREGRAREYLLIGGRWVDHYNTARINGLWTPP